MSVVLSEHLPLLATAPDGIQKLRGLILELAVRGKLVPQEPRDEPASELLKRIAKERARLEGATTRKKNDQAPLGNEMSSFGLPESWAWVRFGEIALHNAGKTLDKGRNAGQPRDYITTSNLYWGRFELRDLKQMPIGNDELERCTARKNDLLICEGGEAGRAAVWPYERNVCFQNHVHRARFFGGIDPYFGFRFFEWLNASGEIDQYRKGVGISNMSGKALASIPFPLPPLAEQHRIVAKVDELMALCDRLEAEQTDAETGHAKLVETLLGALSQSTDAADLATHWRRLTEHFHSLFNTESSLDALKQTILQLAVMGRLVPQNPDDEPASELLRRIKSQRPTKNFGVGETDSEFPEGINIPKVWEWASVEVLTKPGETTTYGILKPVWVEEGIPTVRVTEMKTGTISMDALPACDPERASKFEKTKLQAHDLLISKDGTIGKTAFVPPELAGGNITQHVLRFPITDLADRTFVRLTIDAPFCQEWMAGETKGVALKGVNVGDFRRMPIPFPPIAEQHRIVAKVDELMALCDRLKADLAESRTRQSRLSATLIETALQAA